MTKFSKTVRVFFSTLLSVGLIRVAKPRNPNFALASPEWSFSPGAGNVDNPLPDGERVYVSFRKASESFQAIVHLFGLEAATGRELWHATAEPAGRFRSQGQLTEGMDFLASAGHVYFTGKDERVHCLDGATGRQTWQSEPVFSFLAAEGNTVYVLGSDRRLLLLDAENGRVRGCSEWQGNERTRLELSHGRLFLVSADVQALDPATLRTLWHSELHAEAGMRLSVMAGSESIYVQTGSALHALDISSGQRLWTSAASSPAQALDSGLLYFTSHDPAHGRNVINILGAKTGKLRNQLSIPNIQAAPYGGLTVLNGVIYGVRRTPHNALSGITGRSDSALCAIESATGKLMWCSPTQYEYLHPAVVGDGRVFAGATGENGRPAYLYAFRLAPAR